MKIPKYAYIALSFAILLFVNTNAKAATTEITTTIPLTDGQSLYAYTQSYTNIYGHTLTHEDDGSDTYVKFDPAFNVILTGVNQQYLNGYIILTVNISPSFNQTSTWTYEGLDYVRPASDEGLKVFVGLNNYNYFRVCVMFDNYYNTSNQIDLGTFIPQYVVKYGDITPMTGNFTTSFSIYSNHAVKSAYFENNRTTLEIYNAVQQATGPELANIVNLLSQIKSQDLTYYVSLVNQLSQLHTDNYQLHTDLTGILNEIDLDFQAVQTVLDLFPSYRTAVLQYWQDLLAMNAAQSSEAAEIESQYNNKEQQSESLSNTMNSVVMPTISGQDLDILGNIDTNAKTNFFGLIALITHNELVTKIMLVIVIGAFVGYIMYGKKQ